MNFIDLKANISMKESGMDMEKLRNLKVIIKRENSGTEEEKHIYFLNLKFMMKLKLKYMNIIFLKNRKKAILEDNIN